MDYLIETQKTNLDHINKIIVYTTTKYMSLDISARRNLEITEKMRDKSKKGTLLWVLDKTSTSMGGRMLRRWLNDPLVDVWEINNRLEAVKELKDNIILRGDAIEALKKVNINIEKGEFVFIVGSSGSGKTTLFKLLLKELDPTAGNITVAGYDYSKIKNRDIPKVRRRIGVVFQNFRLLKDRTIYENVAFAQRVIQTPARYIRRRVPAMLTLVGLADKYKSYPKELSGGEQQRVAMARALVNNPDIILADEPTGNLDPKNSLDIMNLLEDINKRGTTVVVVTHNKDIVNEMKKRVITLKKGVIISDEKEGGYIDED